MLFYQLEVDQRGLRYILDMVRLLISTTYTRQFGDAIRIVLVIDIDDVEEERIPYDEPAP